MPIYINTKAITSTSSYATEVGKINTSFSTIGINAGLSAGQSALQFKNAYNSALLQMSGKVGNSGTFSA